jgi:hypothetical protein
MLNPDLTPRKISEEEANKKRGKDSDGSDSDHGEDGPEVAGRAGSKATSAAAGGGPLGCLIKMQTAAGIKMLAQVRIKGNQSISMNILY